MLGGDARRFYSDPFKDPPFVAALLCVMKE